MRTNQREFFTQLENNKTFKEALAEVQEHISGTYSSLVVTGKYFSINFGN